MIIFVNRYITLSFLITIVTFSNLSAADPDENSDTEKYHYFSVEEANKLLPDVEKCMNAINNVKNEAPHIDEKNINPDELQMNEENIHSNMKYINTLLQRLKEAGVIIRHMKVGLVDFPHLREGRVIFLCWQAGENKIRYWHEVDGGKAGRKPLYF